MSMPLLMCRCRPLRALATSCILHHIVRGTVFTSSVRERSLNTYHARTLDYQLRRLTRLEAATYVNNLGTSIRPQMGLVLAGKGRVFMMVSEFWSVVVLFLHTIV
ncbi:hypothetical protein LY76DRAFT_198152 [Colletotrichum caudatum]|nr:hypothetical protein LY76DRAFT_198152 [Colletotrichum caudatum]